MASEYRQHTKMEQFMFQSPPSHAIMSTLTRFEIDYMHRLRNDRLCASQSRTRDTEPAPTDFIVVELNLKSSKMFCVNRTIDLYVLSKIA